MSASHELARAAKTPTHTPSTIPRPVKRVSWALAKLRNFGEAEPSTQPTKIQNKTTQIFPLIRLRVCSKKSTCTSRDKHHPVAAIRATISRRDEGKERETVHCSKTPRKLVLMGD